MSDRVSEHHVLHPLDDYTVVVGQCVITREVVAPTLSNHWVGAHHHRCEIHDLWVIWPQHRRQINFAEGLQAHIPGQLDRDQTLGIVP